MNIQLLIDFSGRKSKRKVIKKYKTIEKIDKYKVSLYKKLSPNMRGEDKYKRSPVKLKRKLLYLKYNILKKKKEPIRNIKKLKKCLK